MYCKNCGIEISNDSKFCSSCGAKTEFFDSPKDLSGDEYFQQEIENDGKFGFSTSEPKTNSKYTSSVNTSNNVKQNEANLKDPLKFIKNKVIEIWKKMNWIERVAFFIALFLIPRIPTAIALGKISGVVIGGISLILITVAVVIKRNIIKTNKKWISVVSLLLSAMLIIPFSNLLIDSKFEDFNGGYTEFNEFVSSNSEYEISVEEKNESTTEKITESLIEKSTRPVNDIDYKDAVSFENALNNGKKVEGKIVKFEVNAYKPDSILGINCWAGEHLNFISSTELDIEAGDIIVARVTDEAQNVGFSSDSWKIPFVVIEIIHSSNKQENLEKTTSTTPSATKPTTTETKTTEPSVTKPTTTRPTTTVEPPVYYSTNTRKTVGNGNSGVYAYKDDGKLYDVYYIIDLDEGYVYYFLEGENNNFCDKVKIESGDLNSVLIITYHDGNDEWSYGMHFKYKNHSETLIVQDNDGFEIEYRPTDLDEALKCKNTKTVYNY